MTLALAQADVGIAVDSCANVAQESPRATPWDPSFGKILWAMTIARNAVDLICQNWRLNLDPDATVIGLFLLGAIGPIQTILISNEAAIVATLNALRPLTDCDDFRPGQR